MSRFLFGLVSVLFLMSGATALAFEAIWIKRFSQVWGSSAEALAAVAASILLGLGLGAWIMGRLAPRIRRPLFAYGVCEGGVALLALAVAWEISFLSGVSAAVYPLCEGRPGLLSLVHFGLTLIVVVPPAALMGATLPLLVRMFTVSGRPIGVSTSWLYALNTLGAAAGVGLTGFSLLPRYGIVGANRAAVVVSAGVAGIAMASAWTVRVAAEAEHDRAAGDDPGDRAGDSRGVLAAAFLAGWGALVLQMVWARELSLLLGGTTYAFTALLTVFIAGMGAGSLLFRMVKPSDEQLARWIPVVVLALVSTTAIGFLLSPALARWVGELGSRRADFLFDAGLGACVSALLGGIPTLVMGFLFPTFVQLGRRGATSSAAIVGRVYVWNTAGSILGAALTALILFPGVGVFRCAAAAVAAYVLALVLLVRGGAIPRSARTTGAIVIGASLCGLWMVAWQPDPRLTNLGLHIYGSDWYSDPTRDVQTRYFETGASANVLVVDERSSSGGRASQLSNRTLRVNGKIDGDNRGDMLTQLGLAWLPRLIRPEAGSVLVIGFGTGTTAGASLQFPGTEVDCVEIERATFGASALFHDVNFRPEESPSFRILFGDARSHIQGTDRTYDLIVSEPSNPWIAGVAHLYTREFFEAARRRLGHGGLLAQWIDTYAMSEREFVMILRTVRSVFPHTAVLRTAPGDLILVASAAPVDPSRDDVDRIQPLIDGNDTIREALEREFGFSDAVILLLAHTLLDEVSVADFMEGREVGTLNTDANLRLESDAPKHRWGDGFELDATLAGPTSGRLLQRLQGPR